MPILEKKALAAWKREFDLHVMLIMKQERVSKAVALIQAYHEGVETQATRLGQPELPMKPTAPK